MKFPCDARELIPHRDTMLLIDTVLDIKEGRAIAIGRVRSDNLFLDSGILDNAILIEYMAQATAGLAGYRSRAEGAAVGTGFLVGLNQVACHGQEVRQGDELRIEITETAGSGGFGTYEGIVYKGSLPVCQGTVKVFNPGEASG